MTTDVLPVLLITYSIMSMIFTDFIGRTWSLSPHLRGDCTTFTVILAIRYHITFLGNSFKTFNLFTCIHSTTELFLLLFFFRQYRRSFSHGNVTFLLESPIYGALYRIDLIFCFLHIILTRIFLLLANNFVRGGCSKVEYRENDAQRLFTEYMILKGSLQGRWCSKFGYRVDEAQRLFTG